MIKEMGFADAVQFAKAYNCYFRPEFSDNWISLDFLWTSRYGVPIKDNCGSIRYIKLDPSITTATRWEFLISDEMYEKFSVVKKELKESKVVKECAKVEQFPSPVRLCDIKYGDMFRLADDVYKGLYCNYGQNPTGMISVVNFEEHPDSNHYSFKSNTLVYKADKNGEIIDATSEV